MSIPKRSEIPVEFTWDLSAIFENDAAWEAGLKELSSYPAKLAAFAGRLGESAATLLAFSRLGDEAEVLAGKVYGYASLGADVDLSDAAHQAMLGKARSAMTRRKCSGHMRRATCRQPGRLLFSVKCVRFSHLSTPQKPRARTIPCWTKPKSKKLLE